MRTVLKRAAVLPAAFAVLLAGASVARGANQGLNAVDRDFLMKLHQDNLTEIELGKLAQEKGESQQIRNFGARLVKDHTAADEKIQSLASAHDFDLSAPYSPSGHHERNEFKQTQKTVEKLEKLSGPEFDKTFRHAMIKGHAEDIADVSSMMPKMTPDVRALASSLMPTLKEHERLAKSLPKFPETAVG